MRKPHPDELQAAGEQRLAEWGVATDASVAALIALLHRDASADVAIAHRLGAIASAESAAALATLERETTDTQLRREVKRARYRLQQRGVEVAAPAAPTAPAPILATPIEGYLSPLDGRGDQLVWLVKPQPSGALHFFAVLNDPDGLREVALHAVTRKALKALRGELERRHEVRLVAVDWHYADFLVRRAFDWARARDARMDGDYPALRAQFSRQPAPSERPGTNLPAIDNAATDDAAALAASAEMLGEPEMRTWFRPLEELQPSLEEMSSVRESPLVLNEMQQQERFESIIQRAVDELFGGAQRDSWSRRFAEQAVYFAATRRPARAAQALAASAALQRGVAAHEVPVCAQIVRASLAMYFQMAMQREQERQQSSLVMTPQQAAAQRRRPR
ncbi:MAG: hypothetical protein SF182_05000 [Deltaproteobacteria bacterium]|nr:hypothetical protein [Deltaproteobacteria bacterium]